MKVVRIKCGIMPLRYEFKKDVVKMTTDNSNNGRIMVTHFDSERFQLFYSSL